MFKKLTFLSAAAMSLALAVPAEAQWVNFDANNDGSEYWDNTSSDGELCNVGYVVIGTAGNGNTCNNQRPVGWLPFGELGYDLYNATPTFTYFGGSIAILQALNLGGDVAGENRDWGYWTSTELGGAKTKVNVNDESYSSGGADLTGLYWGLWVNTTDGIDRFSDLDMQFTRFAKSTGCAEGVCGPVIVGIEDINILAGGDKDYQDMIAQISIVGVDLRTTVPEPSTYALMAAGLAALGFAARRRRNA